MLFYLVRQGKHTPTLRKACKGLLLVYRLIIKYSSFVGAVKNLSGGSKSNFWYQKMENKIIQVFFRLIAVNICIIEILDLGGKKKKEKIIFYTTEKN